MGRKSGADARKSLLLAISMPVGTIATLTMSRIINGSSDTKNTRHWAGKSGGSGQFVASACLR